MFACRICSQLPSTEYAPMCTSASTPLLTRSTSAQRPRSALRKRSPLDRGPTGRTSVRRSEYRPASSRRKCSPTSPAAPVSNRVFTSESPCGRLSILLDSEQGTCAALQLRPAATPRTPVRQPHELVAIQEELKEELATLSPRVQWPA